MNNFCQLQKRNVYFYAIFPQYTKWIITWEKLLKSKYFLIADAKKLFICRFFLQNYENVLYFYFFGFKHLKRNTKLGGSPCRCHCCQLWAIMGSLCCTHAFSRGGFSPIRSTCMKLLLMLTQSLVYLRKTAVAFLIERKVSLISLHF